MTLKFTTSYLEDSITVFHYCKKVAEGAMAQVSDEQLTVTLDAEMNSIAIIVKHITGNMRSRWTDFLTTDGEKGDRDRDSEFTDPPLSRDALNKIWDEGWKTVFAALSGLTESDMGRTILIRGEEHSVMQAISRQIAHYSYHCGQIVLLAKHFQADHWQSLSVPRGQSAKFNARVQNREASQR